MWTRAQNGAQQGLQVSAIHLRKQRSRGRGRRPIRRGMHQQVEAVAGDDRSQRGRELHVLAYDDGDEWREQHVKPGDEAGLGRGGEAHAVGLRPEDGGQHQSQPDAVQHAAPDDRNAPGANNDKHQQAGQHKAHAHQSADGDAAVEGKARHGKTESPDDSRGRDQEDRSGVGDDGGMRRVAVHALQAREQIHPNLRCASHSFRTPFRQGARMGRPQDNYFEHNSVSCSHGDLVSGRQGQALEFGGGNDERKKLREAIGCCAHSAANDYRRRCRMRCNRSQFECRLGPATN
jgi:hypothetical protein